MNSTSLEEVQMPYMLLVMEAPGQRATRNLEEGKQLYDRMLRFASDLKSRGLLLATESLQTRGTRVAVREGKPALTDGPFAEAKELVGGFFLLDCQTREQAIAIASECPAAQW